MNRLVREMKGEAARTITAEEVPMLGLGVSSQVNHIVAVLTSAVQQSSDELETDNLNLERTKGQRNQHLKCGGAQEQ